MARLYAYAALMRAGLGNRLFPWARSEVFARDQGLRLLAPNWVQAKLGPFLRRERDKRLYLGQFDNSGYVRGLRRLWILKTYDHLLESRIEADPQWRQKAAGRNTLAVFEGMKGWFDPIVHERDYILRRLTQVISPRIRQMLAEAPARLPIVAHVRRGDMSRQYEIGEPFTYQKEAYSFPTYWFRRCIENVRAALGQEAPVLIFSDGWPEQLADLLSMPKVSFASPGPAIHDILLMSRARILITSGNSSFSGWAAFLGGMPSLWYPGTTKQVVPDRPENILSVDAHGNIPPGSVDALRAGWSA